MADVRYYAIDKNGRSRIKARNDADALRLGLAFKYVRVERIVKETREDIFDRSKIND